MRQFSLAVRAGAGDAGVEIRERRAHAAHRLVGVGAPFGVARELAPEIADRLLDVGVPRLDGEEHLQRGFSGGGAGTHGFASGYHRQ